MGKYIPKSFAPNVYRAWANIFKTLSVAERSELLMAIAEYPDYEPQGVALWPFFKGEIDRQYESFVSYSKKQSDRRKGKTTDDDGEPRITTDNHGQPAATINKNNNNNNNNNSNNNSNPKKETPPPAPSAQDAPVSQPSAGKKAKRSSLCKPKEVPEALWNDWLSLRKQKRLPLTAQALAIVQAEATKAGKSLAEAIEICLQNSWAGFKASWLENQQSRGDSSSSSVFKAVPRRTEEDEDIDFGFENFRVAK